MDIKNVKQIEQATYSGLSDARKIGIALFFIFIASIIAVIYSNTNNNTLLICSVVIGVYMAMNIGANDVANNVGPAVGSKTMSLIAAIFIAAIFEALGAIVAGGDVVDTIRSDIVSQSSFVDINSFIAVMLSALLAGALWLNVATFIGAPVSTTHSIVGGLIGASIAAGGFGVIHWDVMGRIVLSWVISPISGGIIAALFLMLIKHTITYKQDKLGAARKTIPIFIFIISYAFTLYLLQKGLSKIVNFELITQLMISLIISIIVVVIAKPFIDKKANILSNNKDSIGELFNVPLIFSAALLSFAHGANDVANAIGPLAAINQALSGIVEAKSSVPLWIMVIGGLGISIGLALYGPKLIKTVGSEITEIDKVRAFCIALSASVTVLIASALGLPISSTHVAIGSIFGIGFLREYLKDSYYKMQQEIIAAHRGKDANVIEKFLEDFSKASIKRKQLILKSLKNKKDSPLKLNKKNTKALKRSVKEEIVKRSAITKIIMAWIITVPLSALLSAAAYIIVIKFIEGVL